MKNVAKLDVELTVEESNLLSVAYKNVIGARRASWRIISSIEQKEESKGNEHHVQQIKDYRKKVEGELTDICTDILTVIDEHLLPSSSSGEFAVFYHKMYVSCFFAHIDHILFLDYLISLQNVSFCCIMYILMCDQVLFCHILCLLMSLFSPH